MAIRLRRGNLADFDKNKLVAGELGLILDAGELHFCYSAGNTKKLQTAEDLQAMLDASGTAYSALLALIEDLEANPSELTNILNNITALQNGKADKMDAPIFKYEGKKYLINNPYRYGGGLSLKGQMHCHTTNSDGLDTPTALVTAYKNADFNFMTITDHDYITPNPAISGITWIGTSSEESEERHINAFDITTRATGLTNAQDIISFHNANGKMTSLNHSNWNYDQNSVSKSADIVEIMKYIDLNFIEIFNGTTGTNAEIQWDWALSNGAKIFGLSTDDCHTITGVSGLTGLTSFNIGWVVVHSTENSKDAILNNLRNGNFYASTGNDISISLSDETIAASSTQSSNFTFIGRGGRVLQASNGVTSATYTVKGDEMYVRVKSIRVSDAKTAWSQPLFIDCVGDDSRQISDALQFSNQNSNVNKLINGNFDVWQRGASLAISSFVSGYPFLADRWRISGGNDTGTLPTTTHSRQTLNSGEIPNSYNFYRIASDGAGIVSGSNYNYIFDQTIENGCRYLCGWGKKVTMSFYARSSIANKKLAINLAQEYGADGSATEQLVGTVFNLTTYWKKYEYTFTTNLLAGKTINENDILRARFWLAWGSNFYSRFNASTPEGFGGAGNIDITQVQLCTGEKALPFTPKTFFEELNDCQRYYEKSYNYSVPPATSTLNTCGLVGIAGDSNGFISSLSFKTRKRAIPTFRFYADDGTINAVTKTISKTKVTGVTAYDIGECGVGFGGVTSGFTTGDIIRAHWTADAEL